MTAKPTMTEAAELRVAAMNDGNLAGVVLPTDRAPIADYRTLTGIPLAEAFAKLDAQLPPGAYKAISGGRAGAIGLTDINPGYLPGVLLGLFGPLGVGWGFNVEKLESDAYRQTLRSGEVVDAWRATCRLHIWYAYEHGQRLSVQVAKGPTIPGGSDNSEREWAEKGAVTNALGTAWFFAGYQLSVYQGERSHLNAGKGAEKVPPKDKAPTARERYAALWHALSWLPDDARRMEWISAKVGRAVTRGSQLKLDEMETLTADAKTEGVA